MKRKIILILLVSCSSLYGQRGVNQNLKGFDENRKVHFGFLLGINQLNSNLAVNNSIFTEDTIYSLNIKSSPGFNLGIVTDFHLGKSWDVRTLFPTLIFGQRDFEYLVSTDDVPFIDKRLAESTYLSIPVEIKYKAERYGNWRPYLTGGGFAAYDMVSQKNTLEGISVVRLQKWDYGYTVGFGFEFFLEYFKFSPQFKWDKGIRNLIINDNTPFTNIIDNVRSSTFTISLTFEG
ncbi:MAG: hypothetical protein CMD20_07270 [Flavobacteriales bacterium]|nr:hypothetical protein [Flavobacteriales bacterium]|tara:strand:+ start:1056 stop:1757 length:702 start_codon:yes stop_codon:yes gene_type:complete